MRFSVPCSSASSARRERLRAALDVAALALLRGSRSTPSSAATRRRTSGGSSVTGAAAARRARAARRRSSASSGARGVESSGVGRYSAGANRRRASARWLTPAVGAGDEHDWRRARLGARRSSSAKANPSPSARRVSTTTASGTRMATLRLAQAASASACSSKPRLTQRRADLALQIRVAFDDEDVPGHDAPESQLKPDGSVDSSCRRDLPRPVGLGHTRPRDDQPDTRVRSPRSCSRPGRGRACAPRAPRCCTSFWAARSSAIRSSWRARSGRIPSSRCSATSARRSRRRCSRASGAGAVTVVEQTEQRGPDTPCAWRCRRWRGWKTAWCWCSTATSRCCAARRWRSWWGRRAATAAWRWSPPRRPIATGYGRILRDERGT